MVARARPSNRRAFETRGWGAPHPEGDPGPPEVLSVWLGEDEEVRWIWTHMAGGESAVTGYTIFKKDGDGGDPEP